MHGLVVNKETGRVFVVGSRFSSVERDLQRYDLRMDAEKHDLVILEIADFDATVAFLQRQAQLCPHDEEEAHPDWLPGRQGCTAAGDVPWQVTRASNTCAGLRAAPSDSPN